MARVDRKLRVLEGVSVVEFGDNLAGSICGYHLALLGASVYLLEPDEGCWLRRALAPSGDPTPEHVLFDCYGRGKLSVLQSRVMAGDEGAWRKIDLVIEPTLGPLAKGGLPASWRAGEQDGPLLLSFREQDGTRLTELTAQAASGLSAFLGRAGEPPFRVGYEIVTYSAAVMAVQAVLAALPFKRDHGLGQRIQVPFSRAVANIMNNVITGSVAPEQDTFFSRGWAREPAVSIPAQDGSVDQLFYGPQAEASWRMFCARLGLTELAADQRFWTYGGRLDNAGELVEALGPATRQHGREALLRLMWECGGMAVPRYRVEEAARSEQARGNAMVIGFDSARERVLTAAPWVLNGERAVAIRTPELGADTDLLLALRDAA